METASHDAPIKGAYSTQMQRTIGAGTTRRKVKLEQLEYVFAEELPGGFIDVWPLNENFVPTGEGRKVKKETFLADFSPEPKLYHDKVAPAMRDLDNIVRRADEKRQDGYFFSAELDYKSALRIDEQQIKATFGLGLTYLEQGDTASADQVFRRLSKLEGAFGEQHKHLFNEFGIKLRMNGMYVQALKHYARALHLSKDDEHIMYNLGRVYFEKGNLRSSWIFLARALKKNPGFTQARELFEHIKELVKHEQKQNMTQIYQHYQERKSGS